MAKVKVAGHGWLREERWRAAVIVVMLHARIGRKRPH